MNKLCRQCGTELVRKHWQGKKRTRYENTKRYEARQYCDNKCRSEALRNQPKESNYFFGKKLTPWNKGRITSTRYMIKRGNKKGYWRARDDRGKWELEHRIIAKKYLGLGEKDPRHVHHINKNRGDNRPENLLVIEPSEHRKIHGSRSYAN